MRLEITPRARTDLREIAEFSKEQFGEATGGVYLAGLRASFSRLQEFSDIGPPVPDDSKGRRMFRYRSHLIYYRVEDGHVVIVRVLHKARDYRNHLG